MESFFRTSYLRLVVLSLLEKQGDAYVKELRERVASQTTGRCVVQRESVYQVLEKLEHEGLIASERREYEGAIQGGRREQKYVRLTPEGRKYLAQKKDELMFLIQLIL